MGKLKLLHIAECAGGVDRYLSMLMPYLESQFEQIFVCSYNFDAQKYKSLVDKVYQMKMTQTMSPLSVWREVVQLRKIIDIESPDVVYCHSSFAGGLGRIAAIRKGCKVVYNPHGWAFNQPNGFKPIIYRIIERFLAKWTDIIIAISKFEQNNALKNRIACIGKFKVIVSGVDINNTIKNSLDSNISRECLGIPDNSFVVGMTARLCKTKAPDTFIKAASIIKKKIPNAFFLLIGDGELRAETEALIDTEKLNDCVIITGWVNNPLPYVKLIDVGTLLSRWEGFGFALVEYMLLKKPIVATKVCAIPEVVEDGVNGLLADMDDYESIANLIVELFSDRKRMFEMAVAGQKSAVEKYDIQRVAEQHIKVLSELAEKNVK